MWLSLCALALALSSVQAFNITLSRRNAAFNISASRRDANVDKAARFVGLAYNLLKADPDAAGGGGVDPGFRTTRRVVVLDPAHQESFPRHSCVTRTSTSTIYDEKSFQKKFDLDVAVEASVSGAVAEAKFGLSTSFSDAKDQTSKEKKMTMETQTLCNLGGARLKTELNSHKASEGFKAAVCALPTTYNQATYVQFIDDWGTNYVVEVNVGVRDLNKKVETFTSVYESLQRQFGLSTSVSASYSGAIVSASGSIEMNMNKVDNSQQLKEAFTGSEIKKSIGTKDYPEPIWVRVASLHEMVDSTYFKAPHPSACTTDAIGSLATRRANLQRALNEYPAAKRAGVSASDGKVRIPLEWPKGTYGLLKPKAGCPSGFASNGQRYFDTEDSNNENSVISGNHFDGFVNRNIQQKFCVKTNPLATTNWPIGEYCIYRYRTCPSGFSPGWLYWDDEDSDNANTISGTVPDGEYGRNTKMHFCCRTDGHSSIPMLLPVDKPFYLPQATQYGCQAVYGMHVRQEWIYWDCEDKNNENSQSGVHPYQHGGRNKKVFFCYYWKA